MKRKFFLLITTLIMLFCSELYAQSSSQNPLPTSKVITIQTPNSYRTVVKYSNYNNTQIIVYPSLGSYTPYVWPSTSTPTFNNTLNQSVPIRVNNVNSQVPSSSPASIVRNSSPFFSR